MKAHLKHRLRRLKLQLEAVLARRSVGIKAESIESDNRASELASGVKAKQKKPHAVPKDEYVIKPVVLLSGQRLVRPFAVMAILTVLVVLSAIGVIFSAYDYRHLFHEHQKLIQQRDDLQVEWGQLLLEQSAWAANNRVEEQARKRLEMLVPDPQQIEIVRRGN